MSGNKISLAVGIKDLFSQNQSLSHVIWLCCPSSGFLFPARLYHGQFVLIWKSLLYFYGREGSFTRRRLGGLEFSCCVHNIIYKSLILKIVNTLACIDIILHTMKIICRRNFSSGSLHFTQIFSQSD